MLWQTMDNLIVIQWQTTQYEKTHPFPYDDKYDNLLFDCRHRRTAARRMLVLIKFERLWDHWWCPFMLQLMFAMVRNLAIVYVDGGEKPQLFR